MEGAVEAVLGDVLHHAVGDEVPDRFTAPGALPALARGDRQCRYLHHRDAVASHLPGYFREEGMQRRDFQFGSRRAGPPACDKNGGLIDDFYIKELPGQIHVLNAPSPAATSSLSIGKTIAELAVKHLS